jgi:hypothetical protein
MAGLIPGLITFLNLSMRSFKFLLSLFLVLLLTQVSACCPHAAGQKKQQEQGKVNAAKAAANKTAQTAEDHDNQGCHCNSAYALSASAGIAAIAFLLMA